MSRDNTILILRLVKNKRYIWIVLHVQSHENFENDKWVRWWLSKHCPQQYTLSGKLARHIAHKMNVQHDTEYGVVVFHSNSNINDFRKKRGKLIAPNIMIENIQNRET